MFEPALRPRLFCLPPGADFAACLVRGLRERMKDRPPEAMARVTLWLNSAGMRERVREAFRAEAPAILPRLRLVTEVADDPALTLPRPLPALRRRLELTRLVGHLVAREKDFAPGAAVIDLADSLADLADEMAYEGVPAGALDDPDLPHALAAHWQRSLRFLRIVAPYLTEGVSRGVAALQRRAVEDLVGCWQDDPPADPVIVAGSTGSRGATALLMQAVARLPGGAIVLPGFDRNMTAAAWASLTAGRAPDEDHPQFRFARLLAALDSMPADVIDWCGDAPDAARNRLLSLALRPAPVTDQWQAEGAELLPLDAATRGLALIEAPDPRNEALAIAIALREAAGRGERAALVTPDRTLARRVTAALDRWGIVPDDSAGRPLHLTAPGRLIRQVCALLGARVPADALIALLKHPLVATGSADRGTHLLCTRELELRLRRKGPAFPEGPDLLAWANVSGDAPRLSWAGWLAAWLSALPRQREMPLADWIHTLLGLAEQLAAGPGGDAGTSGLWQREAGEAAHAVLRQLRTEAEGLGSFHIADFTDLITALLEKEPVRATQGTHPLVSIKGTREARELQADLVVLAGLNEGVWPARPAPDPWLSRPMRLRAGLLLPERQIGLAAHDFQIAAAAPRVILSRSLRDDEAETVASRWLERLSNLVRGLDGDAGALQAMRGRGRDWLDLARAVEAPGQAAPARRPSPRPPTTVRPAELPVTAISHLIRDPYWIYARYILHLAPLDPLLPEPDARARGQALHKIVERFVRERPDDEGPDAARDRLMALTDEVLDGEVPWPSARAFWRARIEQIAIPFVRAEAERQARGRPVLLERRGSVEIGRTGVRLTAKPDRIDQAPDGTVHIYDYKSGEPPTAAARDEHDKQLPLEAAMAERGAFTALGPRTATGFTYIRLGGDGEETTVTRDGIDLDSEWANLEHLIAAYQSPAQGYTARRAILKDGDNHRDRSDYDHLSRFGEWTLSDPPAPEDVGHDG
jgi:ATP-dependent helicase/nuclease subunit B